VGVRESHLHARLAHAFGFFLHDLAGHFEDGLVDVEALLGADFEPADATLVEEGDVFGRDGSGFSGVAFVDEAVDAVFGGVLLGLLHPVAHHVLEGFGVADVVH
jgi:hypothetical protein